MKFLKHDNIYLLKDRASIYIMGSGSFGRAFYYSLKMYRPDINILGFINSYRSYEMLGLPVIRIDKFAHEMPDYDNIIICTEPDFWDDIVNTLDDALIDRYLVNTYWDFDVFGNKSADKYKKYALLFCLKSKKIDSRTKNRKMVSIATALAPSICIK